GAPAPTPSPAPTIPPAPTQAPAPTAPPSPTQAPAPVPQAASYEADPMQVRFDAGLRPGPVQPTPLPPSPPPTMPRTDGGIGNVGPAPVDAPAVGNAPRPDAGTIGGIVFDGGIR
ncbi:MAG: hypothetical protein HOV81_42685, partial [Kofleriaceae bacterium]|nr:hypothetical protein [Kofleriaceae bacterium]